MKYLFQISCEKQLCKSQYHQKKLRIWASLILYLMLFLGIICSGCEEPVDCQSDADCREGYRCDLKVYVGECVEIVRVVRCGEQLCQAPEICVRGEVCAIVERNDMTTGGSNQGGVDVPLGGELGGSSGTQAGDAGGTAGDQSAGTLGGTLGGTTGGETLGGTSSSGTMGGDSSGMMSGDVGGSMSGNESQDMMIDMFMDPLNRDQGGTSCESACDCTPGLACIAGLCTSTNAPVYCCTDDSFCPPGEACETPFGVMDICLDQRCETACDCMSGLSCISGRCELGSEPVFCCDSGICPSGRACDTIRGVRSMCPSEECSTACDCSPGQRCSGGVCVFQGDPLFCCESSTCPPGGICQSSTGMASTCDASSTCETACDCTPGMSCQAGTCRLLDAPVFCCDSVNCPVGERCESSTGGPLLICE